MPRIGLTQRVEYLEDRGERRDCLDQAWTTLIEGCGAQPLPIPNTLVAPQQIFDTFQLDGIILTGGNDITDMPGATTTAPERDRTEASLVRYCLEHDVPLLGVCRGMQMIARIFGAELSPIEGHVATVHSLVDCVQDVIPLPSGGCVNSFHDFGMRSSCPSEFRIIAKAEDDVVEAMAHRTARVWGIMWHPERPPHDDASVATIRKLFGVN